MMKPMPEPDDSRECEGQQEMLARVVKDNLRQLEQMADYYEQEGNAAKAKELRDLLVKLRTNLQRQKSDK